MVACLAVSAAAAAQEQGFGFDPDVPVAIDAERLERFEGGQRLLLSGKDGGSATVSQPGVILAAQTMELFLVPGTNSIDRLVATGRVRYANAGGDAVAGDRAVFVEADSLLTVSGNVVVLQGTQVATADTLTYDTETGATVMTAAPGRRVRGLFENQGSD